MKLFLREQTPLICVYILHVHLLFLILWLDGYDHVEIYLYAVTVSGLLLLAYLSYRYVRMRLFYKRLLTSVDTLDESIRNLGEAPLSEALHELLDSQFKKYKERLSETECKMNHHTTFMTQWVHQTKTPLSVLYLLVQNNELDKNDINRELDRIKHALEMILYLARLENIERDLHIEPVSLKQSVEQVLIDNKQLFIHNKMVPRLSISDNLIVESDPKWLSFILEQVVINALRYSAKKSDRIDVVGYLKGKNAVLEIIDYGIGIPKQDLRRVFDPYFTGEKGITYGESTGMGLYLVREVCKHLHHVVEIESKVDSGTTVRFCFPATVRTLQ